MGRAGGFTLLEALLVLALVGVGLLGVAGLQGATLRARGATGARLGGLALALATLEEEGLPQAGSPAFVRSWTCPRQEGGRPGFYTVTVTRQAWAGPDRVQVRVSWPERAGSITLSQWLAAGPRVEGGGNPGAATGTPAR